MNIQAEAHAIRFVLKCAAEVMTPPPANIDTPAGKTSWEKGCLQMQVRYLQDKLERLAVAFETAQEEP